MKKSMHFVRTFIGVLSGTLLSILLVSASPESICPVPTAYSIRSQGQDESREQAGLTGHTNIPSNHTQYGTFALTPVLNRSFSPGHIAVPLFGRDLQTGSLIGISGSKATTRNPKDWLADYFFFPQTFSGAVSFEPRIQSLLVDFDFFLGMDAWVSGLFFRLQSPIVWTKWDIDPCPNNTAFSIEDFFETFADLSRNGSIATAFFDHFCLEQVPTTTAFVIQPLRAAKLCGDCGQTKSGFADVHADLGWNFLMDDDYHLGVFARLVAPTGNRPEGKIFFEPIIGNGHRVEIGGGITSHLTLWRSQELARSHLDLFVHADITHMCKTHGTYVFDLCNKPFSRYMLAGKITAPHTISTLAPVANITRSTVTVSQTTQADIVAMLTVAADFFDWSLGYNFWATGCQKITPQSACCPQPCTTSGIHQEPWALVTLKKSGATYIALNNLGDIHQIIPDTEETPLIPLTTKDIDYGATDQRGLSNKLFTHLNFSWYDHERWIPYIGVGAEVEFGKRDTCGTKGNRCYVSTGCTSNCACRPLALYQWGVWAKGGISF